MIRGALLYLAFGCGWFLVSDFATGATRAWFERNRYRASRAQLIGAAIIGTALVIATWPLVFATIHGKRQ